MNLTDKFQALLDAWRDGVVPLPRLVLALDQVVSDIGALNRDAGVRARRAWGQIEIINALLLDSGSTPTDADKVDIDELLVEVGQILGEAAEVAES